VSASYFDVLGVEPILGRRFTPDDEQPGNDTSVLLLEGLWRRAFAADPGIVGRALLLDGRPRTILGVMPARARVAGLSERSSWATPDPPSSPCWGRSGFFS